MDSIDETVSLRSLRFTARFTPGVRAGDQAIEADPEGPREWDCTEFALRNLDYLDRLETHGESLDGPDGAVDNDDVFQGDPARVPGRTGPFTIRIVRETAGEAP